MPGPAPLPTAVKQLRGNPGKRALNRNEPQFTGAPRRPTWLTSVAKAEWTRVVRELAALDMLRSVDTAALAAYCQSYARWRSAEETISAEGQTVHEPVTNKAGNVVGHKIKRHPAVGIAKDALAAMLRSAALFGFDPSSRSRINTVPPSGPDPFEEYMQQMDSPCRHVR